MIAIAKWVRYGGQSQLPKLFPINFFLSQVIENSTLFL